VQTAQNRLLDLLDGNGKPRRGAGFVDLLGASLQAGPTTGLAQRLMRTSLVPTIYDHYWRPALGRVAKGIRGPSTAAALNDLGWSGRQPTLLITKAAASRS
jgi:hypothetical protein